MQHNTPSGTVKTESKQVNELFAIFNRTEHMK